MVGIGLYDINCCLFVDGSGVWCVFFDWIYYCDMFGVKRESGFCDCYYVWWFNGSVGYGCFVGYIYWLVFWLV